MRPPSRAGREAGGQVVAAHAIEDQIEALALRQALDVVGHGFLAVADDMIRPAVACRPGLVIAGHRGGDFRAHAARDLQGHMADATGTTVDQHALSRLQSATLHQCLPGGDEHRRQGRGFHEAQAARLAGDQALIGQHVFGQCTRVASDATGEAQYLIAGREGQHIHSHGIDDTGHIAMQDAWRPAAAGRPGRWPA